MPRGSRHPAPGVHRSRMGVMKITITSVDHETDYYEIEENQP
jgi:hypothetical protein